MPTTKWQLRSMLERKLEQLVLAEEEAEQKALRLAEQHQEWRAELAECAIAVEKWRARADVELTRAIDAGGQVYMFGGGTHGQFAMGEARIANVPMGYRIAALWEKRVRPAGLIKSDYAVGTRRSHAAAAVGKDDDGASDAASSSHFGDADAADEEAYKQMAAASADRAEAREKSFARLTACRNTAMLWGQRVTKLAIADSTAFALTDLGQVYAWGGTSEWWTAGPAEGATKPPDYNPGNLTERSRLVLGYAQFEDSRAAPPPAAPTGPYEWTPVSDSLLHVSDAAAPASDLSPAPTPPGPTPRKKKHRKPAVTTLDALGGGGGGGTTADPASTVANMAVAHEPTAAATTSRSIPTAPRRPIRVAPIARTAAAAVSRSENSAGGAAPAAASATAGADVAAVTAASSDRMRTGAAESPMSSRTAGSRAGATQQRKLSRVVESPSATPTQTARSRASSRALVLSAGDSAAAPVESSPGPVQPPIAPNATEPFVEESDVSHFADSNNCVDA